MELIVRYFIRKDLMLLYLKKVKLWMFFNLKTFVIKDKKRILSLTFQLGNYWFIVIFIKINRAKVLSLALDHEFKNIAI